ncbi:hypothetical protein [Caballeronia grimmiae]|uniref:hypothetical protein n=1 Tax=Caballeronia grimmiae TaxID=1071679 RepID=UPI0038B87C60
MKRDSWILPVAVLALVGAVSLGFSCQLGHGDWPTWIQAVGSVGAIVVAIWILYRQHEQDREAERQEVRAFVSAVREELATMWAMYELDMRTFLKDVKPGEYLDVIFPGTPDVFTIYNNASAQVGRVPDLEIRQLIVIVYAQAKSLVSAFQLNNFLVQRYHNLNAARNDVPQNVELAKTAHQTAVVYAGKIREMDTMLAGNIDQLINAADKWLAS